MAVSRLLHASIDLVQGNAPGGHWIGVLVGPRACWVAWEESLLPPLGFESRYPLNRRLGGSTAGVEKTNIPCTCQG